MKKIGILGGIAWPSTAEYYAGLCRLAERRHADAIIEALEHCCIDGAADHIREVVAGMPGNGNPRSTAVYLVCTELPLAFANRADEVFERDGVRYLDSTALHIRAAFDCAMEDP